MTRLSPDQTQVFLQLFEQFNGFSFDRVELRNRATQLLPMMAQACPDDEAQRRMCAEITEWVRWLRAPGYCFSYLLQLLTQQAGSPLHVEASLLYSDAQLAIGEDTAMMSVEVAWRTLEQLAAVASSAPGSNAVIETARAAVTARLRLLHTFYAYYSQPLGFREGDPVLDSLYNRRVWASLRETYPPEASAMSAARSAAQRVAVLRTLITAAEARGDAYHWLIARRLASSNRVSAGELAAAETDLVACLADARQFAFEAEIGHLLRIHAWQLSGLGRYDEAVSELRAALKHEQPISLFGFWYAVTARELGRARAMAGIRAPGAISFGNANVRATMFSAAALGDETQRAEVLDSVLDAYRSGRALIDVWTASAGTPADAMSKRQMVRRYTGNALQAALMRDKPTAALAEIEAAGPRPLVTAMQETRALAGLPDVSDQFLAARSLFQRNLTSVPESFKDYLAQLPAEYQMRRTYLHLRDKMRVLAGRSSDDVADRLLERRENRLVLAFFIDELGGQAVLLDMADGTVDGRDVQLNDSQLANAHATYAKALAAAREVPGYPPVAARAALDSFVRDVGQAIQSALEMLAERCQGRPLVIIPHLQLHAVPFAALPVGDATLVDMVTGIGTLPSLGVLADLLDLPAASPAGTGPAGGQDGVAVTALHDVAGTPFFAGTLRQLAAGRKVSVTGDPDRDAALSEIRSGTFHDVFFACHGHFDAHDPSASALRLTATAQLSLADVWSGLAVAQPRCVVLGACESGLASARIGSEYSGFAGALLAAGARCVVGSLWEVNQQATAVLLGDFLGRVSDRSGSAPNALAAAQRALRQLTRDDLAAWITSYLPERAAVLLPAIAKMETRPFAHPDNWAGFFAAGC